MSYLLTRKMIKTSKFDCKKSVACLKVYFWSQYFFILCAVAVLRQVNRSWELNYQSYKNKETLFKTHFFSLFCLWGSPPWSHITPHDKHRTHFLRTRSRKRCVRRWRKKFPPRFTTKMSGRSFYLARSSASERVCASRDDAKSAYGSNAEKRGKRV